MKIRGYFLLLALLATIYLVPGSAACGEIPINYSFNTSHAEIYERMLEQNASLGEYYEQVCPEFLEGMPPEVRARVYNTTLFRHEPHDGERVFVPPLVTGRVAVATALSVFSVAGVHVGFIGIAVLALLAAAWFIRDRKR